MYGYLICLWWCHAQQHDSPVLHQPNIMPCSPPLPSTSSYRYPKQDRWTRQVRRKRFNWNLASQLASSPPVFSSFQRGMHVVDQQEASSSAQWLQICMYACIGLAFPLFMLLMPLMIYILVWLVSMLVRQTM